MAWRTPFWNKVFGEDFQRQHLRHGVVAACVIAADVWDGDVLLFFQGIAN